MAGQGPARRQVLQLVAVRLLRKQPGESRRSGWKETMAKLKEGDFVSEGDFLGTIGGSGNGAINEHPAHLHYELKIDGVNVNPVIDANNLIDPQTLIAPEIHENLQPIFVYGERKQIKIDLQKLLTY